MEMGVEPMIGRVDRTMARHGVPPARIAGSDRRLARYVAELEARYELVRRERRRRRLARTAAALLLLLLVVGALFVLVRASGAAQPGEERIRLHAAAGAAL